MNPLLMWITLALPTMAGAVLIWYQTNFPKQSKYREPEDPLAAEARRLAEEEVAEMDWRFGTGDKPEHILRAERADAAKERDARDKEARKRMVDASMKWESDQADKAAAKLAAYYKEKYGEREPVETESERIAELYAGALRNYKATSNLVSVKNMMGETLYEYELPEARTYRIGDRPDPPPGRHYPRPRHSGTQSRGAG